MLNNGLTAAPMRNLNVLLSAESGTLRRSGLKLRPRKIFQIFNPTATKNVTCHKMIYIGKYIK